jgi:ubiquinol-cytochrome c reductase cytochrome b subunit
MAGLRDWLDDRTGYRALVKGFLEEPILGGARWSYVFGSALVVLFLLQAVSGIALAAYYSPSATDAWASVNYVQTQVYLGWLLRGVHHYGASAMVVLVVLHLLQVVLFGAFKPPREVNWLTGFVLLQLVLGFALTGYLLPWDQKGYWATQVATSILSTVPWIGERLQLLVQGGPEYGNLTLTRFYALHVLVLPLGLVLFGVVHVYLFRKHGVTPPPRPDPEAEEPSVKINEPFYPGQLLRDAAFSLAVFAVIVGLSVLGSGAPLDAPADPASEYLARPEWYFLPLFQVLKYFEGPLEVVGTVILPSAVMGLLALLPFFYGVLRKRTPRAHGVVVGLILFGVLVTGGLGALAAYEDATSATFRERAAIAKAQAAEAKRLAALGVPVVGPGELYKNDPLVFGLRVFQKKCATCHHPCSNRPFKGDPCLEGYASREWLTRLIHNPQSPFFFGNTKIDEMDPFTGSAQDLKAIVEFVYAEGGREDVDRKLAEEGARLYERDGCEACHALTGEGNGIAPDLKGYAGETWLRDFIRAPDDERFYSDKNKMDSFDHAKLSDEELEAVVAYLRSQATRPVEFP